MWCIRAIGVMAAAWAVAGNVSARQVTQPAIQGVTNFAQVETTVACAGATTPEAMAEVKRLGFESVINLRQADEEGAKIDEEAAAAKAAGLRYVHLPLNSSNPDPAVVDEFLVAIAEPANQPAFIHCASGNRAAAMWMIKRVVVDRWDLDRASTEAAALGLKSSGLRDFVVRYVQRHGE